MSELKGLFLACLALIGLFVALSSASDGAPAYAQPRPERTAYIVVPCSMDEERVNGRCVTLSPAQKAERERQRAAEAARKARFEADVRAEMDRLGAHREAEIRRKLELRERALAAMPRQPAEGSPPPKQCSRKVRDVVVHEYGSNRTDALLKANSAAARSCGLTGVFRGQDEPTCTGGAQAPLLPRPPIGNCLACISLKQAQALGYEVGKGWPATKPMPWSCSISAKCEVDVCTGDAGASRQ